LFSLVSFNFYDDKFGFETELTIDSAMQCAQDVHKWLGARFDKKKLQQGKLVDILGVTYDLIAMVLRIKAERKKEINLEIDGILGHNVLEPGKAGKLKGKLMFAASQLWGKVGRAFLLAVSERQYSKFAESVLGMALRAALVQWKKLITNGPPRQISALVERKADVVIFTDGFFPDPRKKEKGDPRVGASFFSRVLEHAAQFSEVIPLDVIEQWLHRETQIFMVELIATVLVLETFRHYLKDKYVLLFVDAEAAEGALVKGYSSRTDVSLLVGRFWDLAQELNCSIYIDRVPTDANCSDAPSRNHPEIGEALGWHTVHARWPKDVWTKGRAWDDQI